MGDYTKVACLKCGKEFWIVKSIDLPPAEPEEAFEHWCPYCEKPSWVELVSEDKTKTP